MKRTQDANLGGMIFHVEEDAYARLDAYLESVKTHFRSYPDSADIVADIESRIAEQCVQGNSSRIVTLADVEGVISAMGTVDQFGDTAEQAPGQASAAAEQPPAPSSTPVSAPEQSTAPLATSRPAARRLFRDPDEGLIAGVAAGLAAYFGVSMLVVRLLFLGLVFINGTGVILYLVLWVLVPVAKTTTDKLIMRGDPVTLASVEQRVRAGIAAIPLGTRSAATQFASSVGSLIRVAVIGLAWVVGIAIAVAMAAAAVGLTVALEMALLNPTAVLGDVLFSVFPVRGLAYYLFVISIYFVALIPLLAIGLLALAALRRRTIASSRWVAALLGIWLVSLLVLTGLWASYNGPIQQMLHDWPTATANLLRSTAV